VIKCDIIIWNTKWNQVNVNYCKNYYMYMYPKTINWNQNVISVTKSKIFGKNLIEKDGIQMEVFNFLQVHFALRQQPQV